MIKRTWLLLAIVAVLAVTLPAEAVPPLNLPVKQHVLANGLRVLLAPDASLDEVTVIVRYDVGSSDDPTGKDGLAHLTEHLMFDGSKHVPKGEYWRSIEAAGGWGVNAMATLDDTRYFVTVPPEALALVFWLESDRMGFLAGHIDQGSLDHERELVIAEIRDKIVDRALGSVGDVAMSEAFPTWHPYHRDHDTRWLSDVTVADVRAFLRTWYTPRNATLIVAGRFDPTTTTALAEKYFGDLPAPAPPARPSLPAVWKSPNMRVDMAAGSTRDNVLVVWPAPALGQPGDAELDLAAAILTDPQGRLQRELVSSSLMWQVGSRENSHRRGSAFVVSGVVADGSSSEDVVRAIEETIRRVGESVTADECTRARAEWADTMLLRMQTSSGRAQWLASAPSSLTPWSLTTYDGIAPTDVARAVRAMLGSNGRTVLVVHHDRRYPFRGVVLGRHQEEH
jgi:predicted Zn-dependent peptidase